MSEHSVPDGGAFILEPANGDACFTPEELNDEHRMILKTAMDFVAGEIHPHLDKIEARDDDFVRGLFVQAGALGLLSTDIPEEYGGLGLDKLATAVVTESTGYAGSFATSYGAHTGIGTLPIVYYGNDEQKKKYLPNLAAGNAIGAYCLTEPGAGSDAVGGCRTKAVLSTDGKHYIINGEKIFITNGGWAKTYIVFAKIDGKDFTAFIAERDFPGVSVGPEEKKMGIKGSSTTPVIFDNARIPVENLLYKPGLGHHIALNVLNVGRYKLGLASVGACKGVLGAAAKFASQRVQFGREIIQFGAIREKLAKMAISAYMNESVNYRTVGLIEATTRKLDTSSANYAQATTDAIREYAVECAICKVYGSESIDFIADESVQIHGGYGYVSDYPAERYYRDARINRIFEGTNEINRLLIPGEILKRGMKGKLPVMEAAMALQDFVMEYSPMFVELPDEPLAYQAHMIEMCKKAILYVSGTAAQKLMQKLAHEQELLMRISDMAIETFAMESGLLRAQKAVAALGEEKAAFYTRAVEAYVDETLPKILAWAVESLSMLAEGDELRMLLVGIRKLLKYQPVNAIAIRRIIADIITEKLAYPLG